MQLRLKQGATFSVTLSITDATGAPLNLNAATMASFLKTSTGVQVATLAITPTDVPGQALVLAPDTSAWPIGILRGDVSITSASGVNISNTFMVFVEGAITR